MPSSHPSSGPWRIALISGSVLALELAFIRQVPAEVRAISYFTNLIFMASFFGLGVGCLLERWRSVESLLPIGLCATAGFVWLTRGLVVFDEGQVHYWFAHDATEGVAPEIPLVVAAMLAFVSTALPFVALGQRLARTMSAFPRLTAYGWDIFGSLAGTLLFLAASALRAPPWIWPPITMLFCAAALVRSWPSRLAHLGAGALFFVFSQTSYSAQWSPYYFVQHQTVQHGLEVWVNSSFHQFAANLDPRETDLADFQLGVTKKFGIAYDAYRRQHAGASPASVLVLGAGTGNDVNIALRNGAKHVVAVEIDPVILDLGRAKNPTRPYADPRVHAIVDDARHYLRESDERFDLVVFGTLDSQTLLSSQANLRLENYVYTREAFRDVTQRLQPGGMIAAYYSIFKPWLVGRLYRTICDSFPGHCEVLMFDPFLFNALFLVGPEPRPRLPQADLAGLRPSTDDWPFLYLERPTVAPIYLQLIAAVFACIVFVFWRFRRATGSASHLEFLWLGMGFTLMESAAVVRLALLFGSTWIVNAVVFSAVLLMVFLGNWAVIRGVAPNLARAIPALLACVAIDYAVTPSSLVGLSHALRVAACVVLIGAPVFFAAVTFSRLFAAQPVTGHALGINLIGAMAGGFAEYVSMLVGMRAVWLLVLLVYLLAWFAVLSKRPRIVSCSSDVG